MTRYQLEAHPVSTLNGEINAVSLEEAFSHRQETWSGADIMSPLLLADGTLWFFGCDTWVGGASPDGTPSPTTRLARNSLVRLHNSELVAWLGPGRSSALVSSTPDMWLWPMSAVPDHLGNIKVLAMRVTKSSSSAWGFWVDGYDVAVVRLSDMTALPSRPAPCAPGVIWNGSATRYGRNVYVYGFRREAPFGSQVVARTSVSGINTTAWRYWDGSAWVDDAATLAPLSVSRGPFRSLWVIAHEGDFYASAHVIDGYEDTDVNMWRSASLTGPFEPLGPVASFPVPTGWMSYAGRVFPSPAGMVALHSVNRKPGSGAAVNVFQYGVHFASADLPSDGTETATKIGLEET